MSADRQHGARRRGAADVGDPHSLGSRTGLPDDLKFLLAKYPRAAWGSTHTIGAMGIFWLRRHAMFRELGTALAGAADELAQGGVTANAFAGWFAPRLEFFLNELNMHHLIEDEHYFPVFAAAEPRLARGFALLDADHHVIHALLEANARSGNAFLAAIGQGGDRLKRASEHYAHESGRLLAGLMRHLEDEEDLVVPLILDRGEDDLGMS